MYIFKYLGRIEKITLLSICIQWKFWGRYITARNISKIPTSSWMRWTKAIGKSFSSGKIFRRPSVWQYGLKSFQAGSTKLERFLAKNQHTQRKLLNFEKQVNGEVSKSVKKCQNSTFKVNVLCQKLSFSFFFLIARPARSDPRNHFVVVKNFLCAICSNFRVFHHVVISSPDKSKHVLEYHWHVWESYESYHIESKQV